MKRIPILLLLMIGATMLAGCSSDPATGPVPVASDTKDYVRGEIAAGATAFEIEAEIDEGDLRILGSNLSYDDEAGVLGVDFTLVNETGMDLEGPVRLLFLQVMPDGVTIGNADSPDTATATGAEFSFAFADTDTVWFAGAATASRTVQFHVEPGVSVGFTSRILVGDEPAAGTIGGLVWNDLDQNGSVNGGEAGVEGLEVMLYSGEKSDHSMILYTATDADGHYAFADLGSGLYTVSLVESELFEPTTASTIQVILVEYGSVVGDFLQADFGVLTAMDDSLECLAVGNRIHAKGWYDEESNGLDTRILEPESEDCDGQAEDKHEDGEYWSRLVGPVTDIDAEAGALAIMGTWVYAADKRDRDEIRIGDRVIANVEVLDTEDGPRVTASGVRPFGGSYDRVRGAIQEIVSDEDGMVTGMIVLNTFVAVPAGFDCSDYSDCDDDHDDDHDDDGEIR